MKQDKTVPKTIKVIGIICSLFMICMGILALGPNGKLWQVAGYGGIGLLGLIYMLSLRTKPKFNEYRESKSIFDE